MKLGLSLQGVNQNLRSLTDMGVVIDHNFKTDLVEQGKKLRDKAKEILETKSQQRTDKRYWTGKLQEAIKLYVGELTTYGYKGGTEFEPETRKSLSISVGPDMRVAPYAEWVEIGHYKSTSKDWWEGYHYMEGAYVEVAPEISSNIAKTLKVTLNRFARTANQRTQNLKTGRITSGFAGVRGSGAY